MKPMNPYETTKSTGDHSPSHCELSEVTESYQVANVPQPGAMEEQRGATGDLGLYGMMDEDLW